MPVLGGNAEKLIEDIDTSVGFSPDGKQFAFGRGAANENETVLMVADADGSNSHKLASVTGNVSAEGLIRPAWSPDGKVILFCTLGRTAGGTIAAVNVADGALRTVFQAKWAVGAPVWMPDGKSYLVPVVGADDADAPGQLWMISYPSGEAHPLTNDLTHYSMHWLGMTRDASAIVSVDFSENLNLYASPASDLSRAELIHSNENLLISATPLGRDRLLLAARNGEYYSANYDGAQQATVFAADRNVVFADACVDGRYIVFAPVVDGKADIWRSDADGRNAVQLTHDGAVTDPFCSPDGKIVTYYAGPERGEWRIGIDGGAPVKLDLPYNTSPIARISPDGKLVYYIATSAVKEGVNLTAVPIAGGAAVFKRAMLPGTPERNVPGWSPDGLGIDYAVMRGGVGNVWRQPINGGEPKQLTKFTTLGLASPAWSADGKTLFTIRGLDSNDIVILQRQPKR
jgi:Tol biopolymer transport system component